MTTHRAHFLATLLVALILAACQEEDRAVQRPEKIVSMRDVVYDTETYAQLDSLWERYYEAYPSEEAYANWMYAARYAGASDYGARLDVGVRTYPANPTLLYLKAMVQHGARDNLEAQSLLERAVELDPTYVDPWFGLAVHYLERSDQEKVNVALRRILEAGAIADEVMDYSYNMLACLEKDAILVTNGDNDTYPGWILTRIVGHRPDIRLVNRSLLNTEWYPLALEAEGIPRVITSQALDSLRAAILQNLKQTKAGIPAAGPFSDPLIERLVAACRHAGRPVYFSATLSHSDMVKRFLAQGRQLGLATLVTPPAASDAMQVQRTVRIWLQDFRTGGMDGWGLRYGKKARAGRMLVMNYGRALRSQMDRIARFAPESRLGLFRWYRDHVVPLAPSYNRESLDRMWSRSSDVGEIREWYRSMNLPQ